jgi:hypothetical protein
VTRLGAEQVGSFLRQQGEELTRIWRVARASERPTVAFGLIDALVLPFFDGAGEQLASGAAPDAVWAGLSGLVRWPQELAQDELGQEWALVQEVLVAACESVNAAPQVLEWLTRAVEVCRESTAGLRGEAPVNATSGVVPVLVFAGYEVRVREDTDTVD